MLLLVNGGLRPSPYRLLSQITHKPVYQNNSFPFILLSGYNSHCTWWLRLTISNYQITLLSEQSSFNSYSFKQVFPSETKEKSFPKLPRQAQCQSPFNANSAQEISAFQRHPYNYPRRISNAIMAYTDGSKWHPWWAINGIKKRALINNNNYCQQKLQKSLVHSLDTSSPNWTRRLKHRFGF